MSNEKTQHTPEPWANEDLVIFRNYGHYRAFLGSMSGRECSPAEVAATAVGKQAAQQIETDIFANIPAPTAQPTAEPKPQPPCTTTVFDYDKGWNACREAVLKMMRSDLKLTRQQWIENVEQLTPTK